MIDQTWFGNFSIIGILFWSFAALIVWWLLRTEEFRSKFGFKEEYSGLLASLVTFVAWPSLRLWFFVSFAFFWLFQWTWLRLEKTVFKDDKKKE